MAANSSSSKLFPIKLWHSRRTLINDFFSINVWPSYKHKVVESIQNQIQTQPQNPPHQNYSESNYSLAAKSSSSTLISIIWWLSCKSIFIIFFESNPDLVAQPSSLKQFQIRTCHTTRILIFEFFLSQVVTNLQNTIIRTILSQILFQSQSLLNQNYSVSNYELAAEFSSSNLISVNSLLSCKIFIIDFSLSQFLT